MNKCAVFFICDDINNKCEFYKNDIARKEPTCRFKTLNIDSVSQDESAIFEYFCTNKKAQKALLLEGIGL